MYLFNRIFLNIGAMKSGTSWLYELIKEHSEIGTVPIKEIHYFWEKHGDFQLLSDRQRIETAKYHLNRLLPTIDIKAVPPLLDWIKLYLAGPVDDAWFASLFPRRAEIAYSAEFSNMYSTLSSGGWDHIKSLVREPRVAYGLRAPLPRMWSHARFHARIIGQFEAMSEWTQGEFTRFLSESGCVRHGAYSKTIHNVGTSIGRENMLIWFFEDIVDRPSSLMKSIESFLGVAHRDYADEKLDMQHNTTIWAPPPKAFIDAAMPFVHAEIEAFARLDLDPPNRWILNEDDFFANPEGQCNLPRRALDA